MVLRQAKKAMIENATLQRVMTDLEKSGWVLQLNVKTGEVYCSHARVPQPVGVSEACQLGRYMSS